MTLSRENNKSSLKKLINDFQNIQNDLENKKFEVEILKICVF